MVTDTQGDDGAHTQGFNSAHPILYGITEVEVRS
jgi:hypothetical protein